MKILVAVKRVIDPYAKVKPLPDGSGLDVANTKFDINPFDEIAVEEAVRQKESNPSIQVVVASIGSAACEDQLRKALAIGADEAILVETEDALDSSVVANELKALVEDIKPDVVLMGKQATDDDCNQAGQMLAAKLGWPQATFACKVTLEQSKATVARETDSGEETLEMPYPCLITTDLRLNEPRYIALPGIIKARSKPLSKRPRLTNVSPKVRVKSWDSPAPRAAGRKVGSVDELISALKEGGFL